MDRLVYPSLPGTVTAQLLEALRDAGPAGASELSDLSHEALEHPPIGHLPDRPRLEAVQAPIQRVAEQHGHPDSRGDQLIAFDQQLAGQLHAAMSIAPWSAAEDGVWAFVTLVLAPAVAAWRYPSLTPERMLGGYHNTFGRLWWRAELLGAGADDPPARLREDQLVAVMERSDAIGNDAGVARALCAAVLAAQADAPDVSAMEIMRDTAKRVTRMTSVVWLSGLSEEGLEDLMTSLTAVSVAGLRGDTLNATNATNAAVVDDDLQAKLTKRGLETIDLREKGGRLWVIGGAELEQGLDELVRPERFTFAKNGSRSTSRRPAWFLDRRE